MVFKGANGHCFKDFKTCYIRFEHLFPLWYLCISSDTNLPTISKYPYDGSYVGPCQNNTKQSSVCFILGRNGMGNEILDCGHGAPFLASPYDCHSFYRCFATTAGWNPCFFNFQFFWYLPDYNIFVQIPTLDFSFVLFIFHFFAK